MRYATHRYDRSHPEPYQFGVVRARARLKLESDARKVHVTRFELALLAGTLGEHPTYEEEQAFRQGFYNTVLTPKGIQ